MYLCIFIRNTLNKYFLDLYIVCFYFSKQAKSFVIRIVLSPKKYLKKNKTTTKLEGCLVIRSLRFFFFLASLVLSNFPQQSERQCHRLGPRLGHSSANNFHLKSAKYMIFFIQREFYKNQVFTLYVIQAQCRDLYRLKPGFLR